MFTVTGSPLPSSAMVRTTVAPKRPLTRLTPPTVSTCEPYCSAVTMPTTLPSRRTLEPSWPMGVSVSTFTSMVL